MRDKITTYDNLLRLQAELSFRHEAFLFRTPAWARATTVVDFGSGNSYYVSRLAEQFPDKSFTCIENDAQLSALARARYPHRNIAFVSGTYGDAPTELRYDFLLARLALSYLSDRAALCDWAAQHATAGATVLVVDADDDNRIIQPKLPLFEGGISRFETELAAAGGRRRLIDAITEDLQRVGCQHVDTHRLIIHSDVPFLKESFYVYMCLVAEMDHGSPLPAELAEELFAWVISADSFAQYGLFASLFQFPS